MIISSFSSQLPTQTKASESLHSEQPLAKEGDSETKSSSSLSESEAEQASAQAEIRSLKNRDREVRAHELAHVSVGGQYVTSGAQFSYQKGPDGVLYAVGGEVSIDTSAVPGDPRATLLKAQVVARAALAPATPSAQDRGVASQATSLMQQARVELALLLSENAPSGTGQNVDAFV